MPPMVKALVTIAIWVLFVKGCLAVALGTVAGLAGMVTPLVALGECAVGIAALILSAVAAKLRQMLE